MMLKYWSMGAICTIQYQQTHEVHHEEPLSID